MAADLKNELPEEKGFSPANLKRMVRFWSQYPELSQFGARTVRQIAPLEFTLGNASVGNEICAQPVRQLPVTEPNAPAEMVFLQLSWSHNIVLMQKVDDLPTRLWYARQTVDQGWSQRRIGLMLNQANHFREIDACYEEVDSGIECPHNTGRRQDGWRLAKRLGVGARRSDNKHRYRRFPTGGAISDSYNEYPIFISCWHR